MRDRALQAETPLTKAFLPHSGVSMSPQIPQGIEGASQEGACLLPHAPYFSGCHSEVSTSVREVLWEDLGQKEKVSGIKDTVLGLPVSTDRLLLAKHLCI